MSRLQQLELVLSGGGDINLRYAHQWETFIENCLTLLSKFDFKFHLLNIDRDEEILLSHFRLPFWIAENCRWYVAYDRLKSILFTVPHFAPDTFEYENGAILPHWTTFPIERFDVIYKRMINLVLNSRDHFDNSLQVKKFASRISNLKETMIVLKRIKVLSVRLEFSMDMLTRLMKESMPRLHSLQLSAILNMESNHAISLEQIRTLSVTYFSQMEMNNVIILSQLLPLVEQLTIRINTWCLLPLLIDQFEHLSFGSFTIYLDKADLKRKLRLHRETHQWFEDNVRRFAIKKNFTSLLDRRSQATSDIITQLSQYLLQS